jgi:nicotinic acid mononucleotide adenylyltransferase
MSEDDKKPEPKGAGDKKSKESKKNEVLIKNTIDINPTLDEAAGIGTAVITWGRMNPPHHGHEKLINKVLAVAKQNNAMPHIYLTHSYDSKKNPLPYKTKIKLVKKAFGNSVTETNAKTLMQVAKEIEDMGHKKLILVVGSDRVKEFKTLLNKYNGKDYTFDSIEVVSAGERDPDAEGVEGMSASKMREAVRSGDETAFKSGLPRKLQSSAKAIFQSVKDGMQIAEEMEVEHGEEFLYEAPLNLAQRRKRAIAFRKIKNKIQRGRKISQRRMANSDKLQKRSRRKAIQLIRRKVAGKKGEDYAGLSPAEKMQIDKRVQQRKGTIGKIAQRLMPKVKKAERERLQSFMKSKSEEIDSDVLNIIMEAYFETDIDADFKTFYEGIKNPKQPNNNYKKFHELLKKDGTVKHDKRFRFNKKIADVNEAFAIATKSARVKTGWKRVPDTKFDTKESAIKYGDKYHTDKYGAKMYKVVDYPVKEEVEMDESELFEHIDIILDSIYEADKIHDNLHEKAKKTGIEFDTIFEKFMEEDDVKEAYQRVNSFIANYDDSLEESEKERTKQIIRQEKKRDQTKHDRMLDRARLADIRAKNKGINTSEEIVHDKCGTPECCGLCDTATVENDVSEEKDSRLKSAGVSGYNKPKSTPGHKTKSHIVVAKDGNQVKTIRFGQAGVTTAGAPKENESDKQKARRKSFKARHAKNIAKGKMSAAYWADREKW